MIYHYASFYGFNALSGLAWGLLLILLLTGAVWYSRRSLLGDLDRKISKLRKSIEREIHSSVKPYFVELTSDAQSMVELATEVWRMEQRFGKFSGEISDNHKRGLESSLQRLKRYLEKNDIEIRDYTSQKYNDGMNVDVLSVEKDESTSSQLVKETVEPAVLHKGQIIKKAKVIITGK
ncbi:MAG: hypothetical protein ABH878_10220 [bacterium]